MSKAFFYSAEENQLIESFAKSGNPVNHKLLDDFCKKYKRSYVSASMKVYDVRKKLGMVSPKSLNANLVKDNNAAKISKGEFKIPVNNWNITNENGQMYLNIKF